MPETLFSVFAGTTRQGRVGLLYNVASVVGDDVLGDDDVGAVRLPNRVHIHVAVQLVADLNRLQELQHLIDLHNLLVLYADVGMREKRGLGLVAEHRDECQRCQQPVITELRGGLLLEEEGVIILDGAGVLADLLPLHDVVLRVPVVHPDDVFAQSHGSRTYLVSLSICSRAGASVSRDGLGACRSWGRTSSAPTGRDRCGGSS